MTCALTRTTLLIRSGAMAARHRAYTPPIDTAMTGNSSTPRWSATVRRSLATVRRSNPAGLVSPYPARSIESNRTPARDKVSSEKARGSRRDPGWPWNQPTTWPSAGPRSIHPMLRPPTDSSTPSSSMKFTAESSGQRPVKIKQHRGAGSDLLTALPSSANQSTAPTERSSAQRALAAIRSRSLEPD